MTEPIHTRARNKSNSYDDANHVSVPMALRFVNVCKLQVVHVGFHTEGMVT